MKKMLTLESESTGLISWPYTDCYVVNDFQPNQIGMR